MYNIMRKNNITNTINLIHMMYIINIINFIYRINKLYFHKLVPKTEPTRSEQPTQLLFLNANKHLSLS